jgi:hypothetical protein
MRLALSAQQVKVNRPCNWKPLTRYYFNSMIPFFGSGRTSKNFLEKTEVNSFRYSKIGDSASELALKASARH